MLFNSLEFIIFFPLVTLLYFLVPHKFRWFHLLLASCVFYAAFIPSYLLILLFLIIIDYSAGILIEKTKHKKRWLTISIVANLSLLFVFKYYNFFISNFNELSGSHWLLLNLALPIGLSFHTFQSLSYTFEVYRGKQPAIRHFGYYALYVMFYPQLVAGPIERPQNLFPQFFAEHKFSSQNLYEGLRLMAWGFFKKVVIADRLSGYVDIVYKNPDQYHGANIWMAAAFFCIQIYADFSGYSDIALGAARCMGFNLMVNFNRPQLAKNIRDFWKRWHISLSSWFRDYFYIPLGGNRKGQVRKNLLIMLTFLVSGFWHGANWTFLIWGLLHGIYVLIYDLSERFFPRIKLPAIGGLLLTSFFVGFAFIFFRAASLHNAWDIISQSLHLKNFSLNELTSVNNKTIQYGNLSIALLIVFISYMFVVERYTDPKLYTFNTKKVADISFFVLTIWLIVFFGMFHKTSFIYFQF